MSLNEQKRRGASQRQSIVGHLVDVYRTQPDKRPLYWAGGIGAGTLLTSLACLGATAPITTTPTVIPFNPTVTETPIPPAPTEAAPVLNIKLTETYDPLHLENAPEISGADVPPGLVANTVDAKWRLDGQQGKVGATYDKDGNVILPPGIEPVKTNQWSKFVSDTGFIIGHFENDANLTTINSPVQKSNEIFRIQGTNSILVTEKLYYYDNQGVLRVTPVFYIVDTNGNFYNKDALFTHFDHIDVAPDMYKPFAGNNRFPSPILGKTFLGESSLNSVTSEDMATYLQESMQAKRNEMIQAIDSGTFDPADFGKVWVASF